VELDKIQLPHIPIWPIHFMFYGGDQGE